MALFEGRHCTYQINFPYGLNNSKYLLPEMDRAFSYLGKNPKELDFVAVGIGPGSYTGIRVGVMAAKTLSYALNRPLITFCSLEAFHPSKNGPYATIFDAKIGGAYILKGLIQDHVIKIEQPLLIALEDLGVYLKEVTVLVTPHMFQIKKRMDILYPANRWSWEEKDPDIQYLNQLTTDKFERGEVTKEEEVELLYLRKTQAEIEKAAKQSI